MKMKFLEYLFIASLCVFIISSLLLEFNLIRQIDELKSQNLTRITINNTIIINNTNTINQTKIINKENPYNDTEIKERIKHLEDWLGEKVDFRRK